VGSLRRLESLVGHHSFVITLGELNCLYHSTTTVIACPRSLTCSPECRRLNLRFERSFTQGKPIMQLGLVLVVVLLGLLLTVLIGERKVRGVLRAT
jgi:hypothetical protein